MKRYFLEIRMYYRTTNTSYFADVWVFSVYVWLYTRLGIITFGGRRCLGVIWVADRRLLGVVWVAFRWRLDVI